MPYKRWSVAIATTLTTILLVLGGLVWAVDLDLALALFIAAPLGLIVGLIAGRFYASARVFGTTFETVVSIFAAVAGVIGALVAAISP